MLRASQGIALIVCSSIVWQTLVRCALSLTMLLAARDTFCATWARDCAVIGAEGPLGGLRGLRLCDHVHADSCCVLRFCWG